MKTGIEQVKEISIIIGKALAQSIDKDNPEEILGKMEELTTLLASSSHAVALAQSIKDEKIGQLAEMHAFISLSASDRKMVFNGRAKEEIYYTLLTERQNAALVHKIEALRSMISYLKSEMNNLQR